MADAEEFGVRPDIAVFADTGWEPKAVYDNISWLSSQLSYPVVTVTADAGRSLRDAVLQGVNVRGRPWLTIPAWLSDTDGHPAGMNWRQCTSDYKIAPIRAEVRSRLGLQPRSPVPDATTVEMWLGISLDEHIRMRASSDHWITHRYPLVDAEFTRADCISWFTKRYPSRTLPRSACAGCPYRSSVSWVQLRDQDPEIFDDAVRIDTALRSPEHHASRMFRNRAFLHVRRVPLAQAVEIDAADLRDGDGDRHWDNECTGICGV